jgi:hypothetical protein
VVEYVKCSCTHVCILVQVTRPEPESPKLTPAKRGAATTPEKSPAKKQTPTHYFKSDMLRDVLKEKYGSMVSTLLPTVCAGAQ